MTKIDIEKLVEEKLEALKEMTDKERFDTVTYLSGLLLSLHNLNAIDEGYYFKTQPKLFEIMRKLYNDTWLPY